MSQQRNPLCDKLFLSVKWVQERGMERCGVNVIQANVRQHENILLFSENLRHLTIVQSLV